METDCFSGSCPQKVFSGNEFSEAIKRESLTTFFWKKVSPFSCSIILSADARRLLYCQVSVTMFTRTLRFGSYRTIVLGPKQPSFEKIAALLFHSTNLTTDGSRLFMWYLSTKGFLGTWIFGSYQTRVSNNLLLKKTQFFVSFNYLKCRRKKNVIPISVCSNVHQDTKFR